MDLIIAGVIVIVLVVVVGSIAHRFEKRQEARKKEEMRKVREESEYRRENPSYTSPEDRDYARRIEDLDEEQKLIDREIERAARAHHIGKNRSDYQRPTRPVRDTPRNRSASSAGGYSPTPYPVTSYDGGYSYGGSSSSGSSSSCGSSSSGSSSSDSGGSSGGGCD